MEKETGLLSKLPNKVKMFGMALIALGAIGIACYISSKHRKYIEVIKKYNSNPRIKKPRKERRKLRKRQARIDKAIELEENNN